MDKDKVFRRIKLTLIIVLCSVILLLAVAVSVWLIGYNTAAIEVEGSPFDIEMFIMTHRFWIELVAAVLIVPLTALMAEGFYLSDRRATRRIAQRRRAA